MVKELLVYPDERIHIIAPDLRTFDESLFTLLEDMKDTMKANNLDALAANQIGVPKAVIVIKEENGDFLEIINPRELSKKDKFISTESTPYYPNITTDVPRFRHLKIVYQDRFGKQHFLTAEGEKAVLLQRKIDYCFGATLANRINPKVRAVFENQINNVNGIEGACPIEPLKRDYIKSFMTKLLFLEFLTLFSGLFHFSDATVTTLYNFDTYVTIGMALLLIAYLIVGYKESKIYTNCSTCHMGYVVATFFQYLLAATVLFIASRYLLGTS